MKVIYRYRTEQSYGKEYIIQKLQEQQSQNRNLNWEPVEIKAISTKFEDNDYIEFVDSPYGNISFTSWEHYGVMLDTGEIFADLDRLGENAAEERQRHKDYFESNGTDDYIELDDIVL